MEQNPKYLELTPEDLKKVQVSKRRRDSAAVEVDQEWYFVAAFGKHFGWGGVQAIMNNEIDLETANVLMAGAIKVDHKRMYDSARASFMAFGAANSKKPSATFDSLATDIVRKMTV